MLSGWPEPVDCCRHLDVSFNVIRHIENIGHLTHLTKLYLCQNKIKQVKNTQARWSEGASDLQFVDHRTRVIDEPQTVGIGRKSTSRTTPLLFYPHWIWPGINSLLGAEWTGNTHSIGGTVLGQKQTNVAQRNRIAYQSQNTQCPSKANTAIPMRRMLNDLF